jgi:UDP-3-O-[3-hydroxymyristoyl] glucosamine N-acyltransferase
VSSPTRSLEEIAGHLAGRLEGDPQRRVERVRAPEVAGDNEIAVVFHRRVLRRLKASEAALVLGEDLEAPPGRPVIRVQDPQQALVKLIGLFHPETTRVGIAAGAHVDPRAHLGEDLYLAAGAWIGAGAQLGRGVQVHANTVIGEGVVVGENSILFPNVTLYAGTRIGKRVRIHAGSVVGSDGFGFQVLGDRSLLKVPQIGRVEIGDDVEIGANCTIDRGTLEATTIGTGTKLDNLVHIGHNCTIGEHCCVVAQVGISGSVQVGARSILLGQAGIVPHVEIAPDTVVGAQAGVTRDIGPGEWFGAPAVPGAEARRAYPLIARLPEHRSRLAALERRCSALEEMLERLTAFPREPRLE